MFLKLVIALIVVSLACAEWTLDTRTSATTLVGVGAASEKLAVTAAAANGIGAFVHRYDGADWTQKTVQGGLLLDSAVTKSGVTVVTSMFPISISTDNGKTFTASSTLGGVSQSANTFGENNEGLALVGTWVASNPNAKVPSGVTGVATSTDSGATWNLSAEVPYARYGAFPSSNTWYVSGGMWGSDTQLQGVKGHLLSSRMAVEDHGMNFVGNYHYPNATMLASHKKASATAATGWFGTVSKTTDGGKTFTQVFTSNLETDYYYFNGISCASESQCVVVGEGQTETGDYLALAWGTFDGGATWSKVFETNTLVSMMGAKFTSETEGWLAGTSKSGRNLYGAFYKTTDGGKTYQLNQSLQNCFAIDLDFANNAGYAACSSSSGASCSVALYK